MRTLYPSAPPRATLPFLFGRRLRATALAALTGLLPLAARAQLNYSPANAQIVSGTYTDLGSTGTAISVTNTDDDNSAAQAIGFTFNYAGQSFTQFVLNTNGFIKLGSTAPSATTLYYTDPQNYVGTTPFNSTDAADVNLIAAFNADLAPSATGTAEFRRTTTGTAPNRVCTIQWKNMSDFGTTALPTQYANLNFQIKLYETSNRIEFVYGSFTASANTPDFRGAEVGLRGTTDYLTSTKGSATAWSATVFQAANYTANRHNFRADVRPTSGLTYRFDASLSNDAAVAEIYSLGKLPIPQGVPHVVTAAITNNGTTTLTALPVTLTVSGATSFTNTKAIGSLAPSATAIVTFNGYTPATTGTNTLTVTVPADGNTANNSRTWSQTVTTNAYRYADNTIPTNAVGNGASEGMILVKHNTAQASAVVNTKVYLSNNTGFSSAGVIIGQSVYGVVVDAAGNILGQTPSYVVQAADVEAYHTFTFTVPVTVPAGDFYVGLAQTNPNAVAYYPVGSQDETPVRTGAYFGIGGLAGGSAPVDFATIPLDARPMIEVTVATPNACATPANFALGTITAANASFSFTAVSGAIGYTLIYGPTGFDPTTGGISTNVTTTTPTIGGLAAQTTYDVYVRTRCSATSTSNLSPALTFTTSCVAPTITLPYTENFDSQTTAALPCGWTQINADGDTTHWRISTGAPYSAPNAMVIRWTEPGITQNDWAVMPGITLAAGQSVDLSFQYRAGAAAYTNKLEVRVGRAATVAGLTTQIFNATYSGNIYRAGLGTFTATTAGTYYFGFHAYSDPDQESTWIDDIHLETTPACPAPLNLTAVGTSTTGATVTFTPRAGTSNFTVIYGLPGFNPATSGTTATATSGTVSLSGLAPSTSYHVYVRANCGGAGNSSLTGPVLFATFCGTGSRTLPYVENFDAVSGGNVLPCGITIINANADTAQWHNIRDAGVLNSSPPNQMRIETATGTDTKDDWFVTPGITLAAGQVANLSFKYRAANPTNTEALEVKVGRTATVAGLTTQIFNNASIVLNTTTYDTGTGTFTAPTAGTYYFGFHAYGDVNSYRLYVDDISITTPCALPTIATTAPTAICPGGSVALTASGVTGGSYQFLLNGSPISGATGATYAATQAGTYTVQATTTGGCNTTSTTNVIVTVNPAPAAPAATDAARCGAGSVTLTASGAPTGGTYQWYTVQTGGTPISGATGATYTTPSLSTTTTYYVSAVSSSGCESPRVAVTATINAAPAPTLTAGSTTTFCDGGSVTFTAANGGAGATYQFLLNGQPIGGATGTSYTATQAGQYTVTATTGTCSGTSPALTVVVNPAPATPTTTSAARCGTGSVTLTAFGAPTGGRYVWYTQATGGTPISGANGATYTTPSLSTTTTYYVATANAANCQSARIPVTATINDQPAPILTPDGPTTFCDGGSVTLTATDGGTGATYQFLLNGQPISGATGTSYFATQSGQYTVVATTATCSGTSAVVTVTATPAPSAAFAYATSTFCLSGSNPVPTITGAAGGSFSSTAGLSLNPSTGAINLSASTAGTYVVTYALTQPCPATATQTVTVTTAPSAAFTYPAGAPCAGSTTLLLPTLGTGASAGTFSATPAGLAIDAATGAIDVSASTGGTYTVTNTIAASGSCAASTATATVTLAPGATASLAAGGPTTFCDGGSVTLTASGSGSYQFLLNGQPISGATATTYVATQTGQYTVQATTTGGCSVVSAPISVTVNAVPSAAFAYGAATYCLSGGVNPVPTITGATGGTFSSTPGLTLDPATGTVVLSSSTAGTYTVTYAVAGPCPASTTQTLTLTTAATADFSYAIDHCAGASGGMVSPNLATGATAGTFTATPAGLVIDPATGVVDASASAPGMYTVTNTVTGGSGCGNATATAMLELLAPPTAPTVTMQPQASGIVVLTASAPNAITYQWYLNGTLVPGTADPTLTVSTATQSGTYTVVATNAAGCASPASAPLTVTVTGTAVALADQLVQLAPNPTLDGRAALVLHQSLAAAAPVLVFDATGRRVFQTTVPAGVTRHELDLRALPTGVYAVRLLTPQGTVVRRLVRD